MLKINYKQVYEVQENKKNEWILIVYSISANHYVGVPIYSKENEKYLYLKSIDKYADLSKLSDYNCSKMKRCIYVKRKPLKITNKDYDLLIKCCKKEIISFLDINIIETEEGIRYLKWCKDKYILNSSDIEFDKIKQGSIYWVNFGINIGSELRKLRPAILWRKTKDKKVCTMIPLTTKGRNDSYYFHYDIECLTEGSAKIENMMNLSFKRILAPYFSKNKLAIITKNDYEGIAEAISKYYLFK